MCWLFIKPAVSSSPMSDAYSIRIHLQLVWLSAGYWGPWFIGLMLPLDSIFFWKLDPEIAFAQRCSCWWCLCLWSHGNVRTVIWFSPGGKRQNACPSAWHQTFHMNAVGSAGASLWRPLTGKGDWETLWSRFGGLLINRYGSVSVPQCVLLGTAFPLPTGCVDQLGSSLLQSRLFFWLQHRQGHFSCLSMLNAKHHCREVC